MIASAPSRPRLYYGWWMILALAITETVSFGVLYYAFTVFIQPMQLDPGWTRGEISGAFSLALLMNGLAAVPTGYLVDHYGTRAIMTIGSILAVVLLLAWSHVTHLAAFYLIQAGMGISMALVLYEPAFAVVAIWFRRKRGRALTVLTFVAGFASVIFVPLAEWLVRLLGWRDALIVLALIVAIVTIPLHALILRRRPQDLGLLPDGESSFLEDSREKPKIIPEISMSVREVLRDIDFWWLSTAYTLNTLLVTALGVHLVPYLTGQGLHSAFAAAAAGAIGVMSLPGRLVFTLLGDYLPRGKLLAAIFLLQLFALLVLIPARTEAAVMGFVLLYGAGFGAVSPARAALIAEMYGSQHYARISSLNGLFLTIARTLAPVLAGTLYDAFASYSLVLWGLVLVSVFPVLAALRIRPARITTAPLSAPVL